MIATDVDASIEGEQLDFTSRKYIPAFPQHNEELDELVFHFRLSMLSKGVISVELNPKKHRVSSTSLLNVADEIQGERLTGFSSKPIPPPVVTTASGTHQASVFSTKEFGFAKIEIGIRALMQMKDKPKKQKKKKISNREKKRIKAEKRKHK